MDNAATSSEYAPAAIDDAFAKLKAIIASVKNIDLFAETEADARLKLIDPILTDVLGWQPHQIHCEVIDGSDRLDYLLDGFTGKAVVEAKRPAKIFDLESKAKGRRVYSLGGAILKSGETGDAIRQAKDYAQNQGIGLAVASNGVQWIAFLAGRDDGVAFENGYAYVFRSLDELVEPDTFRLFFNLLSRNSVASRSYKTAFLKAEGKLKDGSAVQSRRLVDQRKGADQQAKKNEIAKALDPLMRELFTQLSPEREKEIIRHCFVETSESIAADERLERLIAEITEDLVPIDTRGSKHSLLEVVQDSLEHEASRTVVIVGQVGAGKSTYLDKFFSQTLPDQLKKKILLVRLQLDTARSDVATFEQYLRRETIVHLRQAIFGTDAPTFKQLKGAFNTLYHRLSKGEYAPLAKSDPDKLDLVLCEKLYPFGEPVLTVE